MRKHLLTLLSLLLTISLWSQSDKRIAKGTKSLELIDLEVMPYQDNAQLLEEELARREPGVAPHFAQKINTQISPATHGTWEIIDQQRSIWRLQIYSAEAKSLNLGFTKYQMPPDGQLILYTPDQSKIIGPFTPSDNESHQQLWTPILEGDELVIEVQLPTNQKENLELELSYVNHDFIGFAQLASGSCNLDVACGQNDNWEIVDQYRDMIRSVANIGVEGNSYCSGFLINNTRNDGKPYFITANHCGFTNSNAASLVAYWNFENTTCRQPNTGNSGAEGDGTFNTFNTGAYFRAAHSPSDIALLELDDAVSLAAAPFMAGWSIEDIAPADTLICIHHPNNDEKRISFDFDPSYFGMWGRGDDYVPNGNHLIIADWDVGTTEGGSSGAPLFNNRGQVVGQLHGGAAACSNDLHDSFGRLYSAWEGGGTPETRIKDWLDPDNLGVTSWEGMDVYSEISTLQPKKDICLPGTISYTLQIGTGFSNPVDLSTPGLAPEALATFSVNPVAPGQTTVLTINKPEELPLGLQNITVSGNDSTEVKTLDLTLAVFDAAPAIMTSLSPIDGAVNIAPDALYQWQSPTNGNSFQIEVATDLLFTEMVETAMIDEGDKYFGQRLESLTTYYWRIRASNVCGEGDWSAVQTFTTSILVCGLGKTTSVNPVIISGSGTPTVVSILQVNEDINVAGLSIRGLKISHSWVGDLSAELESPEGTIVKLFSRPQEGNCSNNDILVDFEEEASNTSFDFHNTCNDSGYAIAGSFQPEESFSIFWGEEAEGDWKLRIKDDQNQDGGTLEGWTIDFCGTLPSVVGVFPENEITETCPGEIMTLKVQTGTAYQNDVNLSIDGVPLGANVIISPNPVSPGGAATVSIDGWTITGNNTLTITGTDGNESASEEFVVVVLEQPATFSSIQPANNAIDLPLNVSFSWEESSHATAYELVVREESSAGLVVIQEQITSTSFIAVLESAQFYFWQVKALNACGSQMLNGGLFRTGGSTTTTVTPANLTICKNEQNFCRVSVGDGFLSPSSISYVIEPAADLDITFDGDSDNLSGGMGINVTLEPRMNIDPGTYKIVFTANDGVHESEADITVTIEEVPATAILETPEDGANTVSVSPDFSWEEIPDITFYLFEIASNIDFENVLISKTVLENNYTLGFTLEDNTTYFWKVTTYNDCGLTGSAVSVFSTLLTSLRGLKGYEFSVLPNPANDFIQINIAGLVGQNNKIQLYNALGNLLIEENFENGQLDYRMDMKIYAEGVYFLRLSDGMSSFSKRIIVQH